VFEEARKKKDETKKRSADEKPKASRKRTASFDVN
jgi:hypothetical protein